MMGRAGLLVAVLVTVIAGRYWVGGVLAPAQVLSATAVETSPSLPDPTRTPGALNPAVGQGDIGATICVRGWTRRVRPPEQYTYEMKRRQIREWGYADRRLSHWEEDHLVPLDLGGAPADPRNLWPEPRHPADGWGADRKDELELVLNQRVCSGRLGLAAARHVIATDWIAAYRRYVSGGE